MNTDNVDRPSSRSLAIIFKDHLDNTIECGKALSELFLNLEEPDQYISKVKQLEEKGDRLTAEAYCSLELLTYSEYIYITEQLYSSRFKFRHSGATDDLKIIGQQRA